MKHLISIILVVLINTCVFAQWQRVEGPYDGRTNCLIKNGTDVYASFLGGSLYLSSDKGQKWLNIGDKIPNYNITTLAHDGKKLYAGTNRGLYITDDNGNTWNSLNASFNNQYIYYIGIHDQIIVVATGTNIMISTDGGDTWANRTNGINGFMVTKTLVIENKIFMAIYGFGVYYSSDNGKQWLKIGNTGSVNLVYDLMYKDNYLYAGASGGFLRCHINDLNWDNIHTDLFDYFNVTASENGNQLFCGTHFGVKVSNTNGTTWLSANSGINNKVVKKLLFVEDVLIAGTDYNAIYTSNDNGYNWTKTSIGINAIYPFCLKSFDNHLFTSSMSTDLNISEDNGYTWQTLNIKNVNDHVKSIIEHKNKLYALSSNEFINVSSDKGKSWSSMTINSPANILNDLLSKGDYLFGINYFGYPFRSENDGIDWIQLESGIEFKLCYKIIKFNDNLILSHRDGISISYDNGDNWINYSDTTYPASSSNQIACMGDIIISTIFGQDLLISKDSTKTWTSMSQGIAGLIINDISIYQGKIFLATNKGVYYSADTAKTWIQVNENLKNNSIYRLTVHNGHLYIGTQGDGIWKRQIWETTALDPISKINYKFYPNPAKEVIYFESSEQTLEIRIYDTNGKVLSILNKDHDDMSSGIDITSLGPGIYIFQVRTTQGLITEKFVIE